MTETVGDADVVVYGQLSGANLKAPGYPNGATRMTIRTVIKAHRVVAATKQVTIARFFAQAQDAPVDYVVFADVVEDRIDPFRAMPRTSKEFVDYLSTAVQNSYGPRADRLGFFFSYLGDADEAIAVDAYKEFSKASYQEVASAKRHYEPNRIRTWLADPSTPAIRIGLFGLLLGTCGRAEDAPFLMKLLDEPSSRPRDGIDGLMAGYCLLLPHEGPRYVTRVLNDAEAGFNLRYSALGALRFVFSDVPLADHHELIDGLAAATSIPQMSDLIIDELRKREAWDKLTLVLSLDGKSDYDQVTVKQAILRFTLECPAAQGKAYAASIRETDPGFVARVEDGLRFEKQLEAQFSDKQRP